jgi:hypothetical protein
MSESAVATKRTTIDPTDRRRKLGRVYRCVTSLAQQKTSPIHSKLLEPAGPADSVGARFVQDQPYAALG